MHSDGDYLHVQLCHVRVIPPDEGFAVGRTWSCSGSDLPGVGVLPTWKNKGSLGRPFVDCAFHVELVKHALETAKMSDEGSFDRMRMS